MVFTVKFRKRLSKQERVKALGNWRKANDNKPEEERAREQQKLLVPARRKIRPSKSDSQWYRRNTGLRQGNATLALPDEWRRLHIRLEP